MKKKISKWFKKMEKKSPIKADIVPVIGLAIGFNREPLTAILLIPFVVFEYEKKYY